MSQNRCSKKRSYDSLEVKKDKFKHKIVSKCDAESLSSSCCSRKSIKKLLKHKKPMDNLFNVEKIIGMKVHKCKTFYRVRWQGYTENEDSWEPEDNLTNVKDLIEEYLTDRQTESEVDDTGRGPRMRAVGSYEYVPSSEVVACKTKFFDDVRDGKIDLTKNDLYSRVKTRRRLQSENDDVCDKFLAVDGFTDSVLLTVPSEKIFQSNLFDIAAEFIKNNNFDKSIQAFASKSSTIDDISSFNCSISPNTDHSDDIMLQASPVQPQSLPRSIKKSTCTMTDTIQIIEKTTEVLTFESTVKPYLRRLIHKIDESRSRSGPLERLVTSERHLMSIYGQEIKLSNKCLAGLPRLQSSSDLVGVDSFDELRTAITLNKFSLLNSVFTNGLSLDLNETFGPDDVTPLQLAVSMNLPRIVRLLLTFGAVPDGHSSERCIPSVLMTAAAHGHVHVVKALLDHGASPDHRCRDGKTALCYAIEHGRLDTATILLQAGTDFFEVAERVSAASLVNDLFATRRLSQTLYDDLFCLVRNYQCSFVGPLNDAVTLYLSLRAAAPSCLLFPHRWVSVLETELLLSFPLDDSAVSNIHTPILLLVHGVQVNCNFEFWLERNCCSVDSVFVNGERQSSLGSDNFVMTLWPLRANNTITVRFRKPNLLSPEEKNIRVAIVALDVTRNTINTPPHLGSQSRQHH